MEKDVDLIIDIEPGEAQARIELTEMLLDEWYVAKHQRELRLKKVAEIGRQKQQERKEAKTGQATDNTSTESPLAPAL